jgi:hypothetical protein
MTGGNSPRDKGRRAEQNLVRLLQEAGFAAQRVPLSGAAHGRFSADISLPLLGVDRRIEVKCRADGFREIYRWIDGADLLILRADYRIPLVVMRLPLAISIARIAEQNKSQQDEPTL